MPPDWGVSKSFKLQVNDVIVMGSDGLLDNLFKHQILKMVNSNFDKKNYLESAKEIAKKLTLKAKKAGETLKGIWTPFSDEVWSFYELFYDQGKNDDTTIIVGIISA